MEPYLSLPLLIMKLDRKDQAPCRQILSDNDVIFHLSPGSSHNHQAWPGGYRDHVTEVMNLAIALYPVLNERRALQFSLESALLVLFLHDIEKPWRYDYVGGELVIMEALRSKQARKAFRDARLIEYGIELTPNEANALKYVEGELDDYSPTERRQGRLAAFCHMCDNTSARLWPNHPLEADDPWFGARRS